MKKLFILLITLIFLSGCSSVDSDIADTPDDSDSSVHVASSGSEYTGVDMFRSLLIGETFYYIQRAPGEGGEGIIAEVFAWPREGEREGIIQFTSPEQSLIHFTGDESGNLYFLYTDEISDRIYLQKNAADGSLVYLSDTGSFEEIGLLEAEADERMQLEARRILLNISDGAVSVQGQVCFYCVSDNILFLFDKDGTFLGTIEFEGTADYNSGVVNAGEDGIYVYSIDDGEMLYQKLDWESKSLDNPVTIDLKGDSLEEDIHIIYGENSMPSYARISVMDGYRQGFLISSSDTLWRYDPVEKKLLILLKWTAPHISLSGEYVEHVSILDDERVFAVALASSDQSYRQVLIEVKPENEIPAMQTITLGITNTSNEKFNRKLVMWYNRKSQDHQIEIIYYSLDELYMALLKGEGPDLLELSQAQKDVLANKGILENLSPYMDASTLVQEEDLLPSVIRSCTYNEKLLFVIPEFTVSVLAVAEKDMALDMGWTPEELLGLAEANPDIPIEAYGSEIIILLELLLKADMDSFINWEMKECYFDSDRFISLLEGIEKFKGEKNTNYDFNHERFLNREYLVSNFIFITSIDDYTGYREALEGFGSLVGFPNQSRTPHFIMNATRVFSVNSASVYKEEAWSFLEYLLSEEHQTNMLQGYEGYAYIYSPRIDIFEEKINDSLRERYFDQADEQLWLNPLTREPAVFPVVTEADRDAMRYLVDNAYLNLNRDYDSGSAYCSIISEEVMAFFMGDKSAKEVAAVIQSRVSLMLKE